jgi:hypothetical protein
MRPTAFHPARGLGRPAAHAPARVAHLLEERRRFGPAHAAGLEVARRRLAGDIAWPVPRRSHRQPGQLRLREHRAAAGAAGGLAALQAGWRCRRHDRDGREAQGRLAGVPQGMHPRRGRIHAQAAAAGLDRAAQGRRSMPRFAAQPQPVLQDPGGIIPRSQWQQSAGQARRPAGRRAGKTLEFFPETPRSSRPPAPGRRPGKARCGPPACRCRRSAARARSGDAGGAGSPKPTASRPGMAHEAAGGGHLACRCHAGPRQRLARTAGGAAANAPTRQHRPPTCRPPIGTFAALLGALLGGLVLNLMPCVFPILAIKVVGFARHAGECAAHRVAGLAYTAGVMVSFLALGGAMLGPARGRCAARLGLPAAVAAVVAALAALFTLIAPQPRGPVRVRPCGAFVGVRRRRCASARPTLPLRRAGGGHRLALHRAVHGRVARLAVGLPAAQALLVFAGLGLGHGAALSAGQLRARGRAPAAASPGPWMARCAAS